MKLIKKAIRPFSALTLALLFSSGIVKAQTWNPVTSGTTQDLNSVRFTSSTTGFIVGNTGTIKKSTDGGNTWATTTSPVTNNLYGLSFPDQFTGYACGTSGRVIRTVNSGAAWSILSSSLTTQTLNGIKSLLISGNYVIITVGDAGVIYVTPNGGTNWSSSPSGVAANLYGVELAAGALNAWAVGANGTIITSSNGGSSWSTQTSGTTNTLRSVCFISATQGWVVGDNGTIRTTTNGGSTWSAQTSGTTQNLNDVYFISATTGWAVGSNGIILGTMNGGVTWTAQTSNTTANLFSCHVPISCRGIAVGATGTIQRYEFIPAQPSAISGTATVCAGTSQTYSVAVVPGATSYTWSLPSGWTGTSTTNTIAATAGTSGGTMSVVANGSCGSSAARTLSITVNTIPVQPAAINGNASVCSGTSQNYSITPVSGATSYIWSLPSGWGGTSTLSTIISTVGTSGGTISVIATNVCGNSTPQTLNVSVNTIPAQPSAISGTATVCAGTSQTYSVATVPGATSYSWILPSGWTGTSTTNIIATTTGTSGGTISVTANGSCGSSAARTLATTVNTVPAQPAAISGNTTVCSGTSQTYSITAVSGATSYTWSLPSGWSGTSTLNTISSTTGTLAGTISVAATNACGNSTSQTLSVSVNTVPAQPTAISGTTTVCAGTSQTYSVPLVPGATSYSWLIPAGWSGSSTTNSISVGIGSSNGTISVAATNACGSSALQDLNTTILPIPAQPGAISGSLQLCEGTTETYTVPTVTNATDYNWSLPSGWSGTSTTNSINITSGTSTGTISVTAGNVCGNSTAESLQVGVLPLPDDSVTTNGIYIAALQFGASYQWVDCANYNAISGATTQIFGPMASGDYAVIVNLNGCIDTSTCTTINVIGIESITSSASIEVYPNPATDVVKIRSNNEETELILINALGETVMKSTIQKGTSELTIKTLESGVYQLMFVSGKSIQINKLIITR